VVQARLVLFADPARQPSGDDQAREVVRAARYARVDALLLGGDKHMWGEFDEEADRIVVRAARCSAEPNALIPRRCRAVRRSSRPL
jgi:hypothetical protein